MKMPRGIIAEMGMDVRETCDAVVHATGQGVTFAIQLLWSRGQLFLIPGYSLKLGNPGLKE
jgi:hypothetical protein